MSFVATQLFHERYNMVNVSKKIQLITIAALMCASNANVMAFNPHGEGNYKVTENITHVANATKNPHYIDVLGERNYRQMQEMDKNFHLYPNYPAMLFVGNHIGDSTTLTPLDTKTEYNVTIIDMKSSSTIVTVNPSYNEALNNYQLVHQYKEKYPEFGLVVGSVSGAISSSVINHNTSGNVHKDVRMRNTAAGVGLVGLIVGSVAGNTEYKNAVQNSMLANYQKVDITTIYFKINNANSTNNIGRFYQSNTNLLKHGNWKIGDTIRFYKQNGIWMFEKE